MNIIETAYYAGYRVSRSYKTMSRKHLSFPVISIGNLTLGGTGKTPAVIAIAEEAVKRGYRPCILTRGYKGKITKPVFVSRGSGALFSPVQAGDEAVLISERAKGVEVIKAADRYEGGMLSRDANLFILDDGFQHWRLHRDRDVLLIDGIDPFGNRKLFPAGKLREPLNEIRRADMLVLTRAEGTEELKKEIRQYNKTAPLYVSNLKPSSLVRQTGELIPLEMLFRKRVYAFCGIGNPGGFARTLLDLGVSLVGFKSFRDHHLYKTDEIMEISQEAVRVGADLIVTTEKDLVKLGEITLPHEFSALRVDFRIDPDFYDNIFKFEKNKPQRGS